MEHKSENRQAGVEVDRQATTEIAEKVIIHREVSVDMVRAGVHSYRVWLGDKFEQSKSNAEANLVARVYAAMEAAKRDSD